MADFEFKEPELYLIGKWPAVHRLELAMQKVRDKYAEICFEVLDQVSKKHKDLTRRVCNCGENPDEDGPDDLGYSNLGIGKKTWPSKKPNTWPTGFWIGGILLEDLTQEDGQPPFGEVWVFPPEDFTLDFDKVADVVEAEMRRVLGDIETTRTIKRDDGEVYVDYQLPQTRSQLLDLLVKDNARGFIKCMAGHFDDLAKLIKIIDDALGLAKQTPRRRR